MTHFMRKRNISRALQMRVRRYMEYMHEEEKEGSQRGGMLIQALSTNLKNNILIESYFKVLKSCKIFKENFEDKFLKQLCLKIEEFSFAPGEIVCHVLNK